MAKSKITWDTVALHDFNVAIQYIANDSISIAEKVRDDIFKKFSVLSKYPLIHPPDKYKRKNDGKFRAFELHRYRISYHVSEKEIRILRFRHTSRKPKMF